MSGFPRSTAGAGQARLASVDIARGVVMVSMALDHARDYFTELAFDPENLERTWGALFLTRWVTHFCAPLFFFLAGAGAYLYGARHGGAAMRRFLWTRGLWLILLEFSVVGFGWTFLAPWGVFGVIWALGASMLLLGLAVRLPLRRLAFLSASLVVTHDLADPIRPEAFGSLDWIWSLLHVKGVIHILGLTPFVLFPLVPWCAVMGLGYVFGPLLGRPERRSRIAWIGGGMTALFVVLRLSNLYGNPPALPGGVTPGDWAPQPTLEKTLILFFDTEKYPPSLQFLLMTLGPSLVVLACLERWPLGGLGRLMEVFGRVPLFFYVLHIYLLHLLAVLVAAISGQPLRWLLDGAFWRHDIPAGYGHGLPFVYTMWMLTVALLFIPSRWYGATRRRHGAGWLSYL